jgi:hypothetical protein
MGITAAVLPGRGAFASVGPMRHLQQRVELPRSGSDVLGARLHLRRPTH